MRDDRLRYEHLPGASRQYLDTIAEAKAREGRVFAGALDRGIGGHRYLERLPTYPHVDPRPLVMNRGHPPRERERVRGMRQKGTRCEGEAERNEDCGAFHVGCSRNASRCRRRSIAAENFKIVLARRSIAGTRTLRCVAER